mmetsp:Transcript_5181/g.14881  ORF Transcript_5181/g.14881 Transcript_5181/m.14881 type:complete len:215 (-) Transcript_5181:113-757(-)
MGFPLPPAFSHGMTSLRPGTKDFDIGGGSVVAIGLYVAQPLYDSHPAVHPAEYGVLAVEPWRGGQRHKELRPIGVRSCVGHTKDARARVLQLRGYFILELTSPHRLSSPPSPCGVAHLDHEVGDDSVDHSAIVIPFHAQAQEVLARLGGMPRRTVQLHHEIPQRGLYLHQLPSSLLSREARHAASLAHFEQQPLWLLPIASDPLAPLPQRKHSV